MDKTNNIPTLTTIGIDRQTSKLIDKLCRGGKLCVIDFLIQDDSLVLANLLVYENEQCFIVGTLWLGQILLEVPMCRID